jgi:ribosomal protein L30E
MSIKEIKEAIKNEKVLFGINQTMKHMSGKKGKGKDARVFVVKDAREGTKEMLKKEGIDFSLIKGKADATKELDLNFESEVFLIK